MAWIRKLACSPAIAFRPVAAERCVPELVSYEVCSRKVGRGEIRVPRRSAMVKRRRRPELPPRWLTIGEVAQDLGHSPSWLRAERLNKGEKTGFPAINRVVG